AHYRDAEKSVAREVCFVACRRIHPRPVRRNSRCRRDWSGRQSEADYLLLGQSVLRSAELSHSTQNPRCGDHSHRAALPTCRKKTARNPQAISEKCEARLVPGRTAEHGRVDIYGTATAH